MHPKRTAPPVDGARAELVAAVDALLDARPEVVRRYLDSFPDAASGGQAWIAHGLADRIAVILPDAPETAEAAAAGPAAPAGVPPEVPDERPGDIAVVHLGGIDKAVLMSAVDAVGADRQLTDEQIDVLERFAALDGVELELVDED